MIFVLILSILRVNQQKKVYFCWKLLWRWGSMLRSCLCFAVSNMLAQWRFLQVAACHCSLTSGHGEAQPPFQRHFKDDLFIIVSIIRHAKFDQILWCRQHVIVVVVSFLLTDVTCFSFQRIKFSSGIYSAGLQSTCCGPFTYPLGFLASLFNSLNE